MMRTASSFRGLWQDKSHGALAVICGRCQSAVSYQVSASEKYLSVVRHIDICKPKKGLSVVVRSNQALFNIVEIQLSFMISCGQIQSGFNVVEMQLSFMISCGQIQSGFNIINQL